jgi:L-alanine-DL-glutamate epimerase-like enolase superfamily enzyme
VKITNVEVILEERPGWTPAFVWRDRIPGSEGSTLGAWLAIETDAGITGFASTNRGVILKDYVERRFRPELIGQDPLQR